MNAHDQQPAKRNASKQALVTPSQAVQRLLSAHCVPQAEYKIYSHEYLNSPPVI